MGLISSTVTYTIKDLVHCWYLIKNVSNITWKYIVLSVYILEIWFGVERKEFLLMYLFMYNFFL